MRRVWLGLNYNTGSGLTWADGQRVISYPASSRLFVWESRRLLSVEVSYADNSRHYGFYTDGDIAKLPGGGRRGAGVLCEVVLGELSEDPDPHSRFGGKECDLEMEKRQSQTTVIPESNTTSSPLNSDQTKAENDLLKTILIVSLSAVASIAIIGFVIVVVVFKLKTKPPAPERGRIELNPIYGDYYNGEPEYSTVTDDNPYYGVTV